MGKKSYQHDMRGRLLFRVCPSSYSPEGINSPLARGELAVSERREKLGLSPLARGGLSVKAPFHTSMVYPRLRGVDSLVFKGFGPSAGFLRLCVLVQYITVLVVFRFWQVFGADTWCC